MAKVVNFLLFGYLVLFPFGQLARLPLVFFGRPEIHLYLTDLIVFLISSFGVFQKNKKFPPLRIPIFLFILTALLSLLINYSSYRISEIAISSLYLIRFIAYAGLYFAAAEQKANYRPLLLGAGLWVAVFGLIQYFLYPDISLLSVWGWDIHQYRLVGTFLDPGYTGVILVLAMIILVAHYWSKFKPIHYSLFLILYSSLALTYSRSSYLAFLIAMVVISYSKKSLKFILFIFSLMILTYFILPKNLPSEGVKLGRTVSSQARVDNWKQTISLWQRKPLFGIGFNAYRYATQASLVSNASAGADSSLIFVLTTTGVIGFLAYLNLLLRIPRKSLVVLASLTALLIHSWFQNSLFYPWVMGWLWLILASI